MTAVIETGLQSKGCDSKALEFVFFHVSKRAADGLKIESFDARVVTLAFLWRVDGQFGVFEGEEVERVRFGRVRDYVSVDWLIREVDWKARTVQEVTNVMVRRIAASARVLAEGCANKKLSVDAERLTEELGVYAERMRTIAEEFDPWTRFVPPAARRYPEEFCDPPRKG